MLPALDAIPNSPSGAEKLLDSSKALPQLETLQQLCVVCHRLAWGTSRLGHHPRCSAVLLPPGQQRRGL